MASPMLGPQRGSIDPHKKAHFTLQLGERIAQDASAGPSYASVKYNHKPPQTSSSRTTTIRSASTNGYTLKLEDKDPGQKGDVGDVFVFNGQRTVPKKSYVLVFDSSSQTATLEPLSSTYTFNIQSQNGKGWIGSKHAKIYPKREKGDGKPSKEEEDDDADLFNDVAGPGDENEAPDTDNPFDFRHFLNKADNKRGDESEYGAASPDSRIGTGSAMNTPLMPARKAAPPTTAPTAKPKPSAPSKAARKRKSPNPDPLMSRKPAPKKKDQPTPTVRLDRRASTLKASQSTAPSKATTAKGKPKKAAAPPASSKIKSAPIIEDSDSDADAYGEPDTSPQTQPHPNPRIHQTTEAHSASASPSPPPSRNASSDEDEDDDHGALGFEIEVPDARPQRSGNNGNNPRALASLGLGSNLGLGGLSRLRSPSAGPISLASAANSTSASPNPAMMAQSQGRGRGRADNDGVIDLGSYGGVEEDEDEDVDGEGEYEDRDVEYMDIGPPARVLGDEADGEGDEEDAEGEEDDPLLNAMMEGLAGGDSSEESEEE
ncbi:hypothetical protein P154DRAFT_542520 [Amniculicola lignicola CBS 123094]|uniref:Transcription elongation factor Eaf N-terminal domain-containing protein n=1 Tax=Amniculicola lignicola CBS 123094 TaxID=1392246 RepID=A0A6A5WWG9_9PLEO|nr:hypothetical protein P154DRAFT_542520 [Amniculicola lignicola CBS 123094]